MRITSVPARSRRPPPLEDLARRNELLKAHAKALRDHVKTLGDKAYWQAFDTAPDFVVAFIPNEALLQAALEAGSHADGRCLRPQGGAHLAGPHSGRCSSPWRMRGGSRG